MGSNTVLAIDPGPERSAWVVYNGEYLPHALREWGYCDNAGILGILTTNASCRVTPVVIEMVASYGMPVGREVFETCVWIGRFIQRVYAPWPDHEACYVYRKDVKMHLCGSMKAKDSNIRQALIDKFGPGKDKAIGKKASPGPLYGVKKDIWSALAVAVTWTETRNEQRADSG